MSGKSEKVIHGYKALGHKFQSPFRGGEPIWDGKELPIQLPKVELDRSEEECAPGWHFCRDAKSALELVGLWPCGWTSTVFEVEADAEETVERKTKFRSSSLKIIRQLSEQEIRNAVYDISEVFGEH